MPEGEPKPSRPRKPRKPEIIDTRKIPTKPDQPDRFEPNIYLPGTEKKTGLYNNRGEEVKKVPPGQIVEEKV